MKKLQLTLILCLALLAWALPNTTITAQEEEPTYVVVDYMKVAPGMGADYIALEKIWKKIHQARIDAGQLQAWGLEEVLMPYGSSTEYNYVTFNVYKGGKQLANYFENTMGDLSKMLTKEEIAMVERTSKIRTMVRNEVWQVRQVAREEPMIAGEIHVVNFFKPNEGFVGADHGKMENEVWMPVHKARIADGDMKAWGMQSLSMPWGSDMPYSNVTIDVYNSMEHYMAPNETDYFAKVHPGKDEDELYAKTRKVAALRHADVRRVVDVIGF